jgi:hypothetical protein
MSYKLRNDEQGNLSGKRKRKITQKLLSKSDSEIESDSDGEEEEKAQVSVKNIFLYC